jgi:hypothetical protein
MADKLATFVSPIRRYHPRYTLRTRDTNPNTLEPGPGEDLGNQFRDIPADVSTRATHNGGGTRVVPDLTF